MQSTTAMLDRLAGVFSSHYVAADPLVQDVYHVSFDVPETNDSAYVGHVQMEIKDSQIQMLVSDVSYEKQGDHRPTTTAPKEIQEQLRQRYFEEVIAPVASATPDSYSVAVSFPDLTPASAVIEGCEVTKEAAREIYEAGVGATLGGEGSYADPTFDEWWDKQVRSRNQ